MHRGHDHSHDHAQGGHAGHGHGHHHDHGADLWTRPGPVGHNAPGARTVQWQTPHLPHDHAAPPADPAGRDLDLVEAAFVEGFGRASDVVSFLRLSGIPFVGEDGEGRRFHLLRVEIEDRVDVGAVMPLVGGAGVRYDPLPARLTSRRRTLAFAYHDGRGVARLDFAAARRLADRSDASRLELPSA